MGRIFKTFLASSLILTVSSAPSFAQEGYLEPGHLAHTSQSWGMTSGIKLTIPFGAQPKKQSHQARLGLVLSLDHQTQNRWSGVHSERSADLIEIGLFSNATPNLSFGGQNILSPALLNADAEDGEPDENKSGSTGTILLVGGAVLVLGAVVAVNEVADDISDCFLNFTTDDPKCDSR